jgi:hypothetical protein
MEKPDGSKCESLERKEDSTTMAESAVNLPLAPVAQPSAEPRWRDIAAQAASETDPQRLSYLVDELIRLLDEERRGKRSLKG